MSTSNLSNFSSSEKDLDCGALYEPYVFKLSLIVVYCMVLLVGLTGNALVITLVYKRKDLRKTINQLIANMAFSDFVFQLTSIPVELAKAAYGQWPIAEPAGSIVCKIQSFVVHVSVYVSVQSLTWIALDRFIAVVFPMKVHLISSRFRVLAIASTWIVALLCGSASSFDSKVVHKNGALECTEKTTAISKYAGAAGSFASLISITILYCTIAVTLRRKNKALPTSVVNGNVQRKRQAVKMSICVVAAFYLCFIPVIIIALLSGKVLERSCLLLRVLWPFTGLTINLSSSANPIICFIFVENYRRGLREVCGSFLIKCSKRRQNIDNTPKRITLQSIRVLQNSYSN
ncbi:QRFP-like peptide receptor [Porites lutea]|uniref:QRFP-like peptide receptor n=1 Tax=Porites lutea TaxID=51062 RepID=UPI003CC61607